MASRPRQLPSPVITVLKFVLTLGVFGLAPVIASLTPPSPSVEALIHQSGIDLSPSLVQAGLVLGGLVLWAILGTLFRPEPEMGDLGLFGGMVDDPFRFSDNWNRTLLSLRMALLPGRFLGYGLIDMFHLLAGDDES